jgi:hypothetical protein
MIAVLAILPAWAAGWALVRRLGAGGTGSPAPVPAWLCWLWELSAGFGAGVAISSAVFFVALWAGLPAAWIALAAELGLFACCGRALPPRNETAPRDAASSAWMWLLRAALALAVLFLVLNIAEATETQRHGDWDAWSIWNLRAKFLSGGAETWRRAVSPDLAGRLLGASHPDYPLLTSAFLARCWQLEGATPAEAGIALGALFSFAALSVLGGALALLTTEALALAGMLILAASELYASQAGSQYADLPLALYITATLGALAAARARGGHRGFLTLAGLMAAAAAWTKNEGIVFVLLAALAAIWLAGARAAWFAAGAAPLALLVAAFKAFLAPAVTNNFPATGAEALAKLADAGRWGQAAGSFGRNLLELSHPWAHPLLLFGLLAVTLGFARSGRRTAAALVLAPLGLLTAGFFVLLLTPADLSWHLSTAGNRLWLQVLPALLLAAMLSLNSPAGPAPAPPRTASGKKRGR